MNSSKTKKVTIPADIMAEINELPTKKGGTKLAFTPEQDAILLHLMANKTKSAVYVWWAEKYGWGGRDSLTRRHRELTA